MLIIMNIENDIKNNYIVVVKTGATWCGPCQSIELKQKYSELVNTFSSKVIFYELDVNKNEDLMSHELFQTNSIPNFKLFTLGEKKIDLVGLNGLKTIEETLIKLII
jgi:thiol-disulfide isomerase/thioredoxin